MKLTSVLGQAIRGFTVGIFGLLFGILAAGADSCVALAAETILVPPSASTNRTGSQASGPASSEVTPTPSETCHALKFDSYFVAQNVKDNLKQLNPDVTHPNFADHFLLLRAELVMETLYLIADCKTGQFFHEKLTADSAKFSATSKQLQLNTKKGETTHYEWDGKSWVVGETVQGPAEEASTMSNLDRQAGKRQEHPVGTNSSTGASSSPTVSTTSANSTSPVTNPSPTLVDSYNALFRKYPAKGPSSECAPLDYSSYFRAQNNKGIIPKLNLDLKKANFAGSKLLLRTETMFEVLYLIADCKTGKFLNDSIKGELDFHPDSRLLLVKNSNNRPELLVWSDSQWIKIPDPVQKRNEAIQNTLYGEKADLLIQNLPNPKHLDRLRFEGLKKTPALDALFRELGTDSTISGICHRPRQKSPECDVEVQ